VTPNKTKISKGQTHVHSLKLKMEMLTATLSHSSTKLLMPVCLQLLGGT